MARYFGLAALVLLAISGCGGPAVVQPENATTAALQELRAGNYDDAISLASEAVKSNPDDAAAYLYRGRAYHYRNGMGDAQRAIEDFGEAIRIAPDSSDAYYSRALVYRDLGQDALAKADDDQARELDQIAQDVYKQLPESAIPGDLPKPDAEEQAKADERAPKSAGEMLRESAESGELGDMDLSSGAAARIPGSEAPAQETELERQYRELVNGGPDQSNTKSEINPLAPAGTSPYSSLLGQPLPESQSTTAAPGTSPMPRPGSATGATVPSTGPFSPGPLTGSSAPGGNWQRPQLPSLQSPFAPRTTSPTGAAGMSQNAQSPFPQSTRGATGYVPPTSPFGPPQATSGGTGVTRPFSSPATSSRPQNSAVRPLYPRDYVP